MKLVVRNDSQNAVGQQNTRQLFLNFHNIVHYNFSANCTAARVSKHIDHKFNILKFW